jgi:hypothetical protein
VRFQFLPMLALVVDLLRGLPRRWFWQQTWPRRTISPPYLEVFGHPSFFLPLPPSLQTTVRVSLNICDLKKVIQKGSMETEILHLRIVLILLIFHIHENEIRLVLKRFKHACITSAQIIQDLRRAQELFVNSMMIILHAVPAEEEYCVLGFETRCIPRRRRSRASFKIACRESERLCSSSQLSPRMYKCGGL